MRCGSAATRCAATRKELGRGPTRWPSPDDSDPREILAPARDRLNPLIQRPDGIAELSVGQLTTVATLVQAAGAAGVWAEHFQARARSVSRRV